MQNKLQELTDKLYNEGLSKGKQEAPLPASVLLERKENLFQVSIQRLTLSNIRRLPTAWETV